MDGFVYRANLEHLRRMLSETTEKAQRERLERLIAEEVAKCPPVVTPKA